ncbi:MAG TPA: TolC family protein [Candidatus Eisenbacteria bacterium]|nr:TolC family protein [Candidatus Eisenbacteria bacterium]
MPLRRATALIAVGLLLAGIGRAGAEEQKTLDECIQIALDQQPTLKAASSTVGAARERVWQSAAAYLPQVAATYTADRKHQNAGSLTRSAVGGQSSTFNFYSTGVGLSQVLFDFGQNLALIHRSQSLATAADADAQTQRDTVVFDVEQAYFGLLAAYRLRDVADKTVKQNQQHLELAQGRFDVGLAPKFDVTSAQVQLANAELAQVTARNNVALGRETLRNVLGLSGPLDFDIVDTLDQPAAPIDEETALDEAYENRPELRSIRAQEEAAKQQIAALQKDYLPKVTGGATYGWSGGNYPLTNNWDIGAAVALSVFNGGLTTAQVGEAKANLQTLQFNAESLQQNVTLEVRQSMLNVRQAAESIKVADKGLQQARENLELAEGRYATGVGAIIELTDAQTSLVGAEASRVQALANYRVAVAAFDRATARQKTS